MANLQWQAIDSKYTAPVRPEQVSYQNLFGFTPSAVSSVQTNNQSPEAVQQILDRIQQMQQSPVELNTQSPQTGLMIQNPNPSPNLNPVLNMDSTGTNTPNEYMQVAYDQFRSRGLNHNQALGLVMNINAENRFIPRYLFGTHQDGNKTAYGALSWQGGRETALLDRLRNKGLFRDNKFVANSKTMQEMANYMVDELQSGKQGNYLNFKGNNPYDYARYANKVYTRSSQSANVLEGRERAYATVGKLKFRNTGV